MYALLMFTWTALTTFFAPCIWKTFFFIHISLPLPAVSAGMAHERSGSYTDNSVWPYESCAKCMPRILQPVRSRLWRFVPWITVFSVDYARPQRHHGSRENNRSQRKFRILTSHQVFSDHLPSAPMSLCDTPTLQRQIDSSPRELERNFFDVFAFHRWILQCSYS